MIRGNHGNGGNDENHGNPGCKPRVPQTTGLEIPDLSVLKRCVSKTLAFAFGLRLRSKTRCSKTRVSGRRVPNGKPQERLRFRALRGKTLAFKKCIAIVFFLRFKDFPRCQGLHLGRLRSKNAAFCVCVSEPAKFLSTSGEFQENLETGRAEYSFREHGFKQRTWWAYLPSLSSGERAQWVPLGPLYLCATAKSPSFSQNWPSFAQNSVSSSKTVPQMSRIARFESRIASDSKSLANRIARFETYQIKRKIVKPKQRFEWFLAWWFESCDSKSLRTSGVRFESLRTANRDWRHLRTVLSKQYSVPFLKVARKFLSEFFVKRFPQNFRPFCPGLGKI